jgi:hypothetical protein
VHALRVMALVEKTMHRLDNEAKAGQVENSPNLVTLIKHSS